MNKTNDLNNLTVETIAEKEAESAKKPETKGETVTIWLPAESTVLLATPPASTIS